MRYSWLESRPQTVAMWGFKVVTIQSASGGRGAFRYADLISIVAMRSCWMTASCRNSTNVRGMMIGL